MMQETLLTFSLNDISGIRFTCKCGASMCLTPGHSLPVPLQCVQCKTPLANDQAIYEAVSEFINGLNKARAFQSDKLELHLVIRAG